MRYKWLVPTTILMILAMALSSTPPALAQDAGEDSFMPGEVVIQLDAASNLAAVAQQFALDPQPLDQFGTRPIYRMAINDGTAPPLKAQAMLADGRVLAAEPNYTGQTPEGRAKSSWAGGGTSGDYARQWASDAIGLAAAHEVTRGAGTTVAVLDTGVDATHPDLVSRVTTGYDLVDLDDDASEEGSRADIAYGHGTHVAGLVALAAPDATILPVRMLEPDGSGNLWVALEALQYAVNPDGDLTTNDAADVINMSFSFLRRSTLLEQIAREVTCEDEDEDEDEDESLCRASAGQGAVFIAAAGNSGSTTPEYPAAEDVNGLLAIGATTEADTLASFSNRGATVDLAAPGDRIISSVPGNQYGTWSGTSMAAPLVAGTAALARAVDPAASAGDVAQRLVTTATPIDGTIPRLDAAAAVRPVQSGGDITCTGTVGAVIVDTVTVPNGATCTLSRTHITGNLIVAEGASVDASGIRVDGNIEGERASSIRVTSGADVDGNLKATGGGTVMVDRTTLGGDVQFETQRGAISVISNTIRGNLQVNNNTGGVTIRDNQIGGSLQCSNNTPAPIGGGNRAQAFEGQCRVLHAYVVFLALLRM